MAEQRLRDIIQQAWCDGDSNPKDKFGDFLNRAAKRIKQAGYVRLTEDQRLPENPYKKTILPVELEKAYKEAQQDMLKANFRKVEL